MCKTLKTFILAALLLTFSTAAIPAHAPYGIRHCTAKYQGFKATYAAHINWTYGGWYWSSNPWITQHRGPGFKATAKRTWRKRILEVRIKNVLTNQTLAKKECYAYF